MSSASSKLASAQASQITAFVLRLLPWSVPLAGIAAWCVFPALTESFKEQLFGGAKKE